MKELKPHVPQAARKADSAVTRSEFEKRMAAFKTAHGFKERYSIVYHCSRFEKPFVTVYERSNEAECFKIASISKLGEARPAAGVFTRIEQKTFDAKQFDSSGWRCPYCSAGGSIHCSCGSNTCSYQQDHASDGLHHCRPGCGAISRTVPITQMTASAAGAAAQSLPGRTRPALPGKSYAALPSPNIPRLPGAGK